MDKYTRELARLREYCEANRVFTVQGITRELLTGFCATWPELYPSTYTRAKVRERVWSTSFATAMRLSGFPAFPRSQSQD